MCRLKRSSQKTSWNIKAAVECSTFICRIAYMKLKKVNSVFSYAIQRSSYRLLPAIAIFFCSVYIIKKYLDRFLRDFIALAKINFYADSAEVIAPTPTGVYGGYLLPLVGITGLLTALVFWGGTVSWYSGSYESRSVVRCFTQAAVRVGALFWYTLISAGLITLGVTLLILPGLYMAALLLPASTAVVHGQRPTSVAYQYASSVNQEYESVLLSLILILTTTLVSALILEFVSISIGVAVGFSGLAVMSGALWGCYWEH